MLAAQGPLSGPPAALAVAVTLTVLAIVTSPVAVIVEAPWMFDGRVVDQLDGRVVDPGAVAVLVMSVSTAAPSAGVPVQPVIPVNVVAVVPV